MTIRNRIIESPIVSNVEATMLFQTLKKEQKDTFIIVSDNLYGIYHKLLPQAQLIDTQHHIEFLITQDNLKKVKEAEAVARAYVNSSESLENGVGTAALSLLYKLAQQNNQLLKTLQSFLTLSNQELIDKLETLDFDTKQKSERYVQALVKSVKRQPDLFRQSVSKVYAPASWNFNVPNLKFYKRTKEKQTFLMPSSLVHKVPYARVLIKYLADQPVSLVFDHFVPEESVLSAVAAKQGIADISLSTSEKAPYGDFWSDYADNMASSLQCSSYDEELAWITKYHVNGITNIPTAKLYNAVQHLPYGSRLNGYLSGSNEGLTLTRVDNNGIQAPMIFDLDKINSNFDNEMKHVDQIKDMIANLSNEVGKTEVKDNSVELPDGWVNAGSWLPQIDPELLDRQYEAAQHDLDKDSEN